MAKRNKKEQLVSRAKIMSFEPLVDDHVGMERSGADAVVVVGEQSVTTGT